MLWSGRLSAGPARAVGPSVAQQVVVAPAVALGLDIPQLINAVRSTEWIQVLLQERYNVKDPSDELLTDL